MIIAGEMSIQALGADGMSAFEEVRKIIRRIEPFLTQHTLEIIDME
jgi:hypothetical protein